MTGLSPTSFFTPSKLRRCPACGHRLPTPPPATCPLCTYDLGDTRVTGDDVTPYAKAYAHGQSGWWRMCEWIWFAGTSRLKHLALMRSSAASRRFARNYIALLLLGLIIVQFTDRQMGWRFVTKSTAIEGRSSLEPTQRGGWIHLATSPTPLQSDLPPTTPVDLWWSVPQAALGAVIGIVLGLLLFWALLALTGAAVTRAHKPPYRTEQRMSAAIHYSTAWLVPIVAGTLPLIVLPFSRIGRIRQWSWQLPAEGALWASGVMVGFGVFMWWFWLMRLAGTAPTPTRTRVVAAVAVQVPILAAVVALLWYFGVHLLFDVLVTSLHLEF